VRVRLEAVELLGDRLERRFDHLGAVIDQSDQSSRPDRPARRR
jgi:hypothetical protein